MPVAQLIANGVITGAIYALIAVGFNWVYATGRFFHVANGAIFAVGAYLCQMFYGWHLPWPAAVLLSSGFCAALGYLVDTLVYQPLRHRRASSLTVLIASLGMFFVLQNALVIVFGNDLLPGPKPFGDRVLSALTMRVTVSQLVIFGVSAFLLLTLWPLSEKTEIGRSMRAVADNRELASLCGLDVNRITAASVTLASVVAAVAGGCISLDQDLQPGMGFSAMLWGIVACMVGGLGTVAGTIVGAFALGLIVNLSAWWLPATFSDATAFVVLIVALLVRPGGLSRATGRIPQ